MVLAPFSLVALALHGVNAAADVDAAMPQNSTDVAVQWDPFPTFAIGQVADLQYEIASNTPSLSDLNLLLVQTNAVPPASIDTAHTWTIVLGKELQLCDPPGTCNLEDGVMVGGMKIIFNEEDLTNANLENLFFCIASQAAPSTCEQGTFSPVFDIAPSLGATLSNSGIVTGFPAFTAALPVTASSTLLTLLPATASPSATLSEAVITLTSGSSTILSTSTSTLSASSTGSATRSSMTTISESPTATITTTLRPTSTTSSKESPNLHRLSTGAIAGIAVGAILLAIILLILAFLIIHRRKLRKMQPEHVILALGSSHSREGSRDLVAEKGAVVGAGAIETTRSGGSGDTAYEEPRRQQSPVHEQSREAFSPQTMSPATREEPFEEPYRDAPIYGDARHSPQIFRGSQHFLGEEGMSPEEIARLEEEERRIDAAIAEAERRQ